MKWIGYFRHIAVKIQWGKANGFHGFASSSSSGTKFSWPYPAKKPWKPKDSWTHQFVCLANVGCQNIPNRSEKRVLKDAGLGDFRVVFSNKRGGHAHIKETLESVFPKTKEACRFEILRSSGSSRSLERIQVPPTGYTVSYSKETLGQAIAYIRPLQKDLSLEPLVKVLNFNQARILYKLQSLRAVPILEMIISLKPPFNCYN